MNLIEVPHNYLLSSKEFKLPSTEEERLKLAQNPNLIKINSFRLENIKVDIAFPLTTKIPDFIHIVFWYEELHGYYSNACYLPILPPTIDAANQTKCFRFLNSGSSGGGNLKLVTHISLHSDKVTESLECTVNISSKFTYQICADRLFDEFSFPDGEQHHDIGESFQYKKGIIATVMEINTEYGVALCSALGFIK